MPCSQLSLCRYETTKMVRIQSVKLGSLKWVLNGTILLVICIMMLWNKKYQAFDLVVSSVTTKVKGMAQTHVPGVGDVVWDEVDYGGPSQNKNSFFVVTNVIVTKSQKQGTCPESPHNGRLCRTDKDCQRGDWDQQSHGIQTGSCVKFDVLKKTCEVSAWCPVETKANPPRPALLAAAENFTVLIKNNIKFPAFNFIRRNILPWMSVAYLKSCQHANDSLCPIFKLGDMVRAAGEKFSEMAIEGGVMALQIKWDCNLDYFMGQCLPKYSFRRLDEKESNKTLYPGHNFRYARYSTVNGLEERTLYKAFGIRFDVMVFGQAGRFSFIQLIIYVGSTLCYYALTTMIIDWLIGTRCYSAEVGQNFSEKKVELVEDKDRCILCVSYVDENHLRLVKRSQKKSLQDMKPKSLQCRKEDPGHLSSVVSLPDISVDHTAKADRPRPSPPKWCKCSWCTASSHHQEELCCRHDLRHCAYEQCIKWRFGFPPEETHPVIPRCCVRRIREEYPSPDGKYSGFKPARTLTLQTYATAAAP